MTAGLLAQYAVIAIAVAWSLAYVLRTRFPAHARRLRGWIAVRCIDAGPAWLRAAGLRLAPPPASGGACGGCDGCGPPG